ncbi:MAG: response regulator transcription factor [Bacteroidetes bacterium]|nr:MAG: response regulator transcription factor [Bacteroidota bacterium]
MKKIKIIFADDHAVVRNGLRALFKITSEFLVVGEAVDGESAIHLAETRKPQVAILDISMPNLNGIEATKLIKKNHPYMKVLILTIHEDEAYVFQMMTAGADGYILKNAEKNEILTAVRTVASGELYFSSGVTKFMVQKVITQQTTEHRRPAYSLSPLTKREIEVLSYITQGLSNKEIAEKLILSISTINTHRSNLMQKLDIHDTAGLVRYAIHTGIISAESEPVQETV